LASGIGAGRLLVDERVVLIADVVEAVDLQATQDHRHRQRVDKSVAPSQSVYATQVVQARHVLVEDFVLEDASVHDLHVVVEHVGLLPLGIQSVTLVD